MIPQEVNLRDLVILVADNNMKSALQGILSQYESIGSRRISYDIYVHIYHDPGCLRDSHNFLRPFINRYQFAIVMFDRIGCGKEENSREEIEEIVETNLSRNGWADRSIAVVLNPELEVWVWSRACIVEEILGWQNREQTVSDWLTSKSFIRDGEFSPRSPKEAMEAVLKTVRKPRSSSIYQQLAQTANLDDCDEPSYNKLSTFLRNRFPQEIQ